MHSHDQDWDVALGESQETQLQLGREMVSAGNGGRPDFEGFVAALRAEADGTQTIWREGTRMPEKQAEINALRKLADEVERVGEHYGFL